jgi:hypothetical protein
MNKRGISINSLEELKKEKDAFGDMKKLYDFLSQKGKDKFGLEEPSTIPTWEMIEEKWNAILPSQTDIDSMPTGR